MSIGFPDDWDDGYQKGKRAGFRSSKLGIERRDEIIANMERTIQGQNARVEQLELANDALSARIGEIATRIPLLGAYPVKPLGKNLKPYQPEPTLPTIGEYVRVRHNVTGSTRGFTVAGIYDSGINVILASQGSGSWYELKEWTIIANEEDS